MDPVSALAIASSCMSLATKSGTLIMRITVLVSEVRDARKDLDGVSRELTSLQLGLSALKDDQQLGALNLPEAMKPQIAQILVNIDLVLNQISDMLIKLSSGKLGRRVQWALTQKDGMNKFRSSLESNKTALEIALTVGSISMHAQQLRNSARQDSRDEVLIQKTESIWLNTRAIDGKLNVLTDMQKDNTRFNTLVDEIESLRTYMISLINTSANISLNAFRTNSETYTQTLLQSLQTSIPDSRIAAIIDLASRSVSEPSKSLSCSCEDIYETKLHKLEVELERRISQYESQRTEDLDMLHKLKHIHSQREKEMETTVATYRQKLQQEVDTNAELQAEITVTKNQIKENAGIITALKTSRGKWAHQQVQTALQQTTGRQMTDSQPEVPRQQEGPNTKVTDIESFAPETLLLRYPLTTRDAQERPASIAQSIWIQWTQLFPNKSMASYGLHPRSYGRFHEHDIKCVLALNQRLLGYYRESGGVAAKPRELPLVRIRETFGGSFFAHSGEHSGESISKCHLDFQVCLVLANEIYGIGAWNQHAFKCVDTLKEKAYLWNNASSLKDVLEYVCKQLEGVVELHFPDVNGVELSATPTGGSSITYSLSNLHEKTIREFFKENEDLWLRVPNPAQSAIAHSPILVQNLFTSFPNYSARHDGKFTYSPDESTGNIQPWGPLRSMHWPIVDFSDKH